MSEKQFEVDVAHLKMVDFTNEDKVLYLKGLEDEMQRCEKLDNNELYTLILDTIRQIDEQKDKLDDLYIQHTALNNILSLRLWKLKGDKDE